MEDPSLQSLFEPVAESGTAARGSGPRQRAIAKQYCPSSPIAARHRTIDGDWRQWRRRAATALSLRTRHYALRLYNRNGCELEPSPGSSRSERKATRRHRRRAAARGFVRVEVRVPKRDADLIRALAETLGASNERAEMLRSVLARALMHSETDIAFDLFGSDLPDQSLPVPSASPVDGVA